ncbi:MAG: ArsR/SmtB family transcription factor [Cyanophyceae cyanobacterium]
MTTPSCCPSLLFGSLDAAEAEKIACVFRVLGEPARLRLINLIATQPQQEACVCELTEPLGLSQPTVSHHLKVLHKAGLLNREQRGTWVYYQLVSKQFEVLQKALTTAT